MHTVTQEYGVCPVCNGTGRMHYESPYSHVVGGFDPETNTVPCDNCGGQTMGGTPTGLVRLRKDGSGPCRHEYVAEVRQRCYTRYKCRFCGDTYDWDTSD